jgi:hypothetical protein
MTAKKSNWDIWKERLPPTTVARLEGHTPPSATAFDAFVSTLDKSTRAAIAAVTDGPPPPVEETCREEVKRFGCVECDNGEFATLRMFRDADGLAKYLGSVEGEDKIVWCFFGTPLRFTVGPQRYLMLPDGQTALAIPLVPGAKIHRIEADLVSSEYQEDGFVGPRYLANNDGLQVEPPTEVTPTAKPALDDDEAGGGIGTSDEEDD